MAKETTGTHSSNYDSSIFSTAAMDSVKEFWGWQMKVGQALTEQSVKMGQNWTEFAYNQMQDAAKMSHDCVKQGLIFADDVRKGFSYFTDKASK